MKLSRRAFEKATKFIESYALDIDAAMYDFYFGDKEVNDVMETLQLYQHENGGFCRLLYGIEYTGPCVKATEHAFKYIHDLKPPVSHMVIPKMMKYVLDNYKPGLGNWGNLLVPEVNDYAHVWWWTYSKDEEDYNNFDDRLKAYNPNGQAGLAAFVCMYNELVPEELYKDIISYPIEKIRRMYDKKSPLYDEETVSSPYNMKSLLLFCDCLKDKTLANELISILKQNPTKCMELDETKWDKMYCDMPHEIVTYPECPLYDLTKSQVEKGLNFIVRSQSDDGSWKLCYSIGKEEEFRKMESMISGIVTIDNLILLQRFGRID